MLFFALAPLTPVCAQVAGTVLPKGTIPTLRGVVSGNVVINAPTPTVTGNTLTINQIDPQVIIDWNTFNIANGSTVQFIQPSSSASALNRIYSADPSIIQGNLTANGQIFLINQNGILFDRGTQINVNTLYASSLNISNPQFLAGAVPASNTTPAFTGGYDNNGNTITSTSNGAIQIGVNGSATAAVPKINAASGGAIVLLAPMINNQSGVITSPDGQVILAAGNKAFLQFPDASDTTLRGLVVEIDAATGPVNLTSMISNMGTLQADRGNVTLAALAVNQGGRISASTALQKNGSIYLQASNADGTAAGTVNLLPGSVIQTPLDATDTSTLPTSQSYDNYRAQVTISGATIVDQGTIRSPAGIVTMTAQDPGGTLAPRVYLDADSVIDVSGVNTTAPYSDNLLTFKVTSNELANSPDQKTGILKGATVTVDLNAGSTLLDLSAYQGAVAQTLAEKATSAGSVFLTSSGDIVQRAGAVVNANAGSITYQGGKDPVTQLLGSDNKVYSITNAPEGLTYTSLLGTFSVAHPHWGQTDVYQNQLIGTATDVAPFTTGAAAGNISIAPGNGLVLDGQLSAATTVGTTQLANAPSGGTLTIGQFNPAPGAAQDFGVKNIVFAPGTSDTLGAAFTASTPLDSAALATTRLSSGLFDASQEGSSGTFHQNGFQDVTIGANQSITVPAGVTLSGAVGGAITLRGQQVVVAGDIALPAGAIALDTLTTVAPLQTGSGYRIEVDGALDTAGQWSNTLGNGFGALPLPSVIASVGAAPAINTVNGGSVSLNTPSGVLTVPSAVVIAPKATIDVSAGGSINAAGKITGGQGGAISIAAANSTSGINRSLILDGTLSGYGFSNGGSLTIAESGVAIGNATSLASINGLSSLASASTGATDQTSAGSNASPLSPAIAASKDSATLGKFTPEFFDAGGFSSYSILGTEGVSVLPGTTINPQQQNYVLGEPAAIGLSSGASVGSVASVQTLPGYSRAPASIALSAPLGPLTLAKGSSITVDPKGSVSLNGGNGGLEDAAAIKAPGGAVSIGIVNGASVTSTIHLTPSASIDVSGVFVPAAPNLFGLNQGTVLAAGSVSLTANNADLLADSGSSILANGAQAIIGSTQLLTQQPLVSSAYTTNAGDITIAANDQLNFNSTLSAHAAGQSAGGSFAVTLTNRSDTIDSGTLRRVVVTDVATPTAPNAIYTDAAIALDPLRSAGFDKLSITAEDAIQFNGPTVNAGFARGVTLDSQQFGVANGTTASVSGAAVVLSNTFGERIPNLAGAGTILDNTLPSLPIATTTGTALFEVQAQTLDLMGSLTINGARQTTLTSTGDTRLTGRIVGLASSETGAALVGGLTTEGNLTMQSSQLYPTTRTDFTISVADGLTGAIVPGGQAVFQSASGRPDAVLSAGGNLTVSADRIDQGGSIQAPLGNLALNAVSSLELTPGSTTSTSGHGQVIPYGGTSAGVSWLYASTNDQPLYNALTGPPTKSMSLTGANVSIAKGANVDISGGGNILGIEFVPGSGGNTDVLAAANTYAIIPSSLLASAPIDTAIATIQNLNFASPASVYNSIHIATSGAVPAGDYALLPGYYALLPGAFLVQVQSGSKYSTLLPGQSIGLANGQAVVPAWEDVSGTSIRSAQTIGVVVQPGSNANKLADYNQFGANFFTQVAQSSGQPLPVVPNDAGQLTLAAAQSLAINGKLLTAPGIAGANTAEIDITGKNIAVVDSPGQSNVPAGYLQIDASSLSSINGSILLGGTRTSSATSVTVTPDASNILIANTASAPLEAPELLLASTGTITMLPGSVLSGAGAQTASARNITIDASNTAAGAFVRASNSDQVTVTRGAPPNSSNGIVTIDSGATIGASGSLLIDATADTVSQGRFALAPSAALSLVSSVVSLGDTPSGVAGLSLDQSQLSSLSSLGALVLKSYGSIDVFGSNVALGGADLKNLTLDTDAILGHQGATGGLSSLLATADSVTLQNSSGSTFLGTSTSSGGGFVINAPTVVLGEGNKAIAGFSSLAVNATEVNAQKVGQLNVGAPVTIAASAITGASGATENLIAADLTGTALPSKFYTVTLAPGASAANLSAASGLGARLSFEGADIIALDQTGTSNVNLIANAGSITLSAQGGGAGAGIELGAGALIDTSGKSQSFEGTSAIANAGNVSLSADHGAVAIASSATVNVAGAAGGGSAGSIQITAPALNLAGNLQGHAAVGQQQGSIALDTGTLTDFSTLNARVNAGGFTQSFDLRLRDGSLELAAGDEIDAHNVTLSADSGSIVLDGPSKGVAGAFINAASGNGGGSVNLNGATGITLQSGSRIDVSGQSSDTDPSAPLVNGGRVALASSTGVITFASGAVIDASAGGVGNPGNVSFTASRTATNGVAVDLAGQILSASHGNLAKAEVDVYGNKVYQVGTTLMASDVSNIENDNQTFMANVDAVGIASLLTGDGGKVFGLVHVRPGVEVQSTGALTLDANDSGSIDLTDPTSFLLANNASSILESGTFTLRAAGTLTLANVSVGLPTNNLYAGNTWNINLIGGADLGAANVLQTQTLAALGTNGSVILDGAAARVTSGTGRINIAAGYDFVIDNPKGVVYTSGTPVPLVNDSYHRWAEGGGDISITAQHDAIGTSSEWVTDWFRRTASGIPGDLGSWWVERSSFEQGVGALGGGNITIAAGDDVTDLSASIPTTGRIYSPNPLTITTGRKKSLGKGPFFLDVEGGGDLSVTAGNDITGGQYFVGLGTGTIQAGGTVGANQTPTQLYLMGENATASRREASINVVAGSDVNLQSINDPTLVAQTFGVGSDPSVAPNHYTPVTFASYSPNSAVSVQAKGGDISIYGVPAPEAPLNPIDASINPLFGDQNTNVEWPAIVSLVAFNGSISSRPSQTYLTYPTSQGSITLLAGQGIDQINLVQTDFGAPGSGPTAVSNWRNPIDPTALPPAITTGQLTSFTAGTPFVDNIVAANGAITNSTFQFPAVSRIYAGTNIDNVQANLQNTQATDVSEIIANTGFFHPAVAGTSIAGPGQLLIETGGTLDLGTGSAGVPALVATGNSLNDSLPSAVSARITLVAGVTGLINLPDLDAGFSQLITAGINKDAALAKGAVAGLFGNDQINGGDINTYLTSVQTDQGSGIDLLAPAGNITVGLTTPPSSTTTIGIVTNGGGAIKSYLSGNFSINQGKVLTALGGDIEIYTTDGSIDAGRGAKTSLTIAPPQREPIFGDPGVITGYKYVISTAAAGSGIQTLTSNSGEAGTTPPPAGSIYLFAPSGTVDAGEAGIVSGANIFIEAQQVLNASNISATGTSVGVPIATTGSLASSLAAAGTTSSSATDKAAADAARAASSAAANAAESFTPSILTVEVLGFGAKQCKETDKQCLGEPQ